MDIYRIGDKLISQKKVLSALEKMIKLRSQGKSQHEVADIMGVDRSFISRLETLGELRKAKQIGVVGFPIRNKNEIQKMLAARGIQQTLLMSEAERTSFVEGKPGTDIVNEMTELIQQFRMLDTVIVLASDMRTKWIDSLLNCQTILVDIGASPLTDDVYVEPERITEILDHLT